METRLCSQHVLHEYKTDKCDSMTVVSNKMFKFIIPMINIYHAFYHRCNFNYLLGITFKCHILCSFSVLS